ncbi:MAG: serine hydrolase domain-containing protein, partial [Rhodococcus sp. (in: high G+C Gram-positive bacteria)]
MRRAVAVGVAALLLSSCAHAVDVETSDVGGGVEVATSASVSTQKPQTDLAALVDPVVHATMDQLAVPGAVVLVQERNVLWQNAYGTRTVGQDVPVTVGDHFRIGSITKTMVGTVVLQLVESGALALTDPVSSFRSDVPNG